MLKRTTHLGIKPHGQLMHFSGRCSLMPGQGFALVMLNNKVNSPMKIMFCQLMSIPWLSLHWKLGEEGILGKYHIHSILGSPGSSLREARARAPAVLFLKTCHLPHGKKETDRGRGGVESQRG